MSSVKLDPSKLLGYKILSHDEDAVTRACDAARLSAKLGAKIGNKAVSKPA
jgi:hypothetical protein